MNAIATEKALAATLASDWSGPELTRDANGRRIVIVRHGDGMQMIDYDRFVQDNVRRAHQLRRDELARIGAAIAQAFAALLRLRWNAERRHNIQVSTKQAWYARDRDLRVARADTKPDPVKGCR